MDEITVVVDVKPDTETMDKHKRITKIELCQMENGYVLTKKTESYPKSLSITEAEHRMKTIISDYAYFIVTYENA